MSDYVFRYAIGDGMNYELWNNNDPSSSILLFNRRHPDIENIAQLIAAAPELFEAAKSILPLIEKAHKSAVNKAVYLPLEEAMKEIRSALEKAGAL